MFIYVSGSRVIKVYFFIIDAKNNQVPPPYFTYTNKIIKLFHPKKLIKILKLLGIYKLNRNISNKGMV